MNRGLKITLIIFGSLAVAGGVTIAILRRKRKKEEQEEKIRKELQNAQELEKINENISVQDKPVATSTNVVPVRNLDKVINNAFAEIKGVNLIPAQKSSDPVLGHPYAEGYANIRSSAEVNNAQGWWIDGNIDNLLGKVSTGQNIGTIVSEKYDEMTPKMRWFNVNLAKPIGGSKTGWVRGDNVTFKSFPKKKSSFDGAFVQKFNTSYPLGSDVFPHPNWMLGYSQYSNDVMSDFEGNLNLDL
jgi:hypothetical protein